MNFDPKRMLVLSGLADSSEPEVLTESINTSNTQVLVENEIRKIVREEIAAFLEDKNEKALTSAFSSRNLTGAMFPSYQPKSSVQTPTRGPGRSLGFLGPGFR